MVGIKSSMAPERSCSSRTIWQTLVQHPQAERQEGINPGRLLADHAGAQHQPVGGDLRLLRGLAQIGQEEPGKAHGISQILTAAVKPEPARKYKGGIFLPFEGAAS